MGWRRAHALSAARRPFALRANPALVLLLLFVAWALFGTLWAPDLYLALRDWIKLATLSAFAWSTAQLLGTRENIEYVLLCLCVSLTVIYAVEILVWFRTVGVGWHFGQRVMEPFSFQHINTFAGLIVASFALGWLLASSAWRFGKLVFALQLATGLVLLWLFASRTAQLSLVALVILALAAQRRPAARWLAVVALIRVRRRRADRQSALPRRDDLDLHNRVELWRGTVELIAERPFVGHGWGDKTFQALYIAHNPVRSEDFPHAHDLPLQLAFGVGLVGLVLYRGDVPRGGARSLEAARARRSRRRPSRRCLAVVLRGDRRVLDRRHAAWPVPPLLVDAVGGGTRAHRRARPARTVARLTPARGPVARLRGRRGSARRQGGGARVPPRAWRW